MAPPDPKDASALRAQLGAGRWFASLPAALKDALLAAGVVRELKHNERLFARGDPPTGLFAALDGSLRVTSVTETGREALLTLVEPPTWFGEVSVLDGQPRTHDCVADEPCRVLQVPQPAMDALLAAEPLWWRALGQLVSGKLRLAFVAMEDMATLPLSARLARRLVLMAEGYGEWQDRSMREVDVRQEQLASMLSTSRQTVNQLLKELEARGAVRLSYGKVEILDLALLRTAAAEPR